MDTALTIIDYNTMHDMQAHESNWRSCTRCLIGEWAEHHVFARGALPCDVLFVGEAPGNKEDIAGLPFVGPSGNVLNKWIDLMPLFSYAITNMVSCRPCDYSGGKIRAPGVQELSNCRPRLMEFVDLIARPKAVILIGKPAEINFPRRYAHLPQLKIKHPSWFLRKHLVGSQIEKDQISSMARFIAKELSNGKDPSPAIAS